MRYEHEAPGDLRHMDMKKLGRIAAPGHRVTGDPRDHTRGAGWEVAHYKALGVTIKRLMTDNGPAYRSQLFARTRQALGIKHTFTRHYRPQTNGKAGRFIRTCLREWAYGRIWAHSDERTTWLPAFLAFCNTRRPHSALGYQPPASRIAENNLLQLNS